MSAPSATPSPRANPATMTRIQRFDEDRSASAAIAKNANPMTIGCEATPQQPAEKNAELSIAASPPILQATCDRPISRKKNHAPEPRNNSAHKTHSFENNTGPNTN